MEAAAGVGATARSALPASQTPPRKEWRAVERNAGGEELERSKVGQSDERTIYEVQQGRVMIGAMDYHSMQMSGGVGALDDGMVQQRLHALARQRDALARQRDALARQGDEVQQMEIELKSQVIARSEIMELQSSFEIRMKEQVDLAVKLQEELSDREQKMHDLERKIEDQERELHAMRLDSEKAWAKEDLLREQNKEIANFRRERENIEAERAHHIKQIHELQDHFQEKERQLMELQEQHRIAQENSLYKEEQLKEAQTWISRIQEMDAFNSTALQAELRERTDQYNQLWLSCQRQFAEMERLHMQTIQQLQLELADARGKSGRYNDEQQISQTNSVDVSHFVQNNGTHHEVDGASSPTESAGSLQNGNSDKVQSFVSSGNGVVQTNHIAALPVAPQSLVGIPPYLPPGQMAALHPYILHQQGANGSVPSHVPQSPSVQFHSVPALSPFQHWASQQVTEGQPQSMQYQLPPSQSEGNVPRPESNYGFEISVDGPLHSEYLKAHMGPRLEPNLVVSSTEDAQVLTAVDRTLETPSQDQQSLDVISSQFREALRLNSVKVATEMKDQDDEVTNSTDAETQSLTKEQASFVPRSSPSAASVHVHLSESSESNASNAVETDLFTTPEQSNSLSAEKASADAGLLGERELLTWIIRTIPAGGKIRISSTLPNRLCKMLAPLHWHDYKRKYGKLDEFVAGHPELFVIEGDYIQLREGAQEIIAATTAVAKVAAAAAASSPYSSSFSAVAVTPMAQANRLKKVASVEARVMPTSSFGPSHFSAMQGHSNGAGHNIPGGHANVKILNKSQDSLELNGVRRPGQSSVLLNIENGASSDRTGLNNSLPKASYNARASVNFVSRQQGRTAAAPSASRR
ncbi:hypothetical protein Droror1_Dr00022659 [Drosera rotundifolia]